MSAVYIEERNPKCLPVGRDRVGFIEKVKDKQGSEKLAKFVR